MNILVVEDERNLADAIVQILIDDHFNAEAVYDGNAGLTAAQSGLYDAVVLDIMLPGIDGIQIVKELRHSGNSIPVLMLTAKTSTGDMVQGLDAGSDDYMTKPFEDAELLARLRALTLGRGLRARAGHDESGGGFVLVDGGREAEGLQASRAQRRQGRVQGRGTLGLSADKETCQGCCGGVDAREFDQCG